MARAWVHDENLAAIDAVDDDTGDGGEEESWNLAGEADGSEKERRTRQPVDEPGGCDARHPCADDGDALAAEEEAEVTMPKRAPCVGEVAGRQRFPWRVVGIRRHATLV